MFANNTVLGAVLTASLAVAAPPDNFYDAKKIVYDLHDDTHTTFYCGCSYTNRIVDHKSCGYEIRRDSTRAARTEIEHVVPAHAFGSHLPCWKEGGRELCSKTDKQFQQMESDLFNLRPAIGEVNKDRSNYDFNYIQGENRQYGKCDFEIDYKKRIAEPSPSVRGDIARIYFYFEQRYGVKILPSQRRIFEQWNKVDPIDEYEQNLIQKTESIMGAQFLEK